eukprot:942403-Rhodomonas_salina.2
MLLDLGAQRQTRRCLVPRLVQHVPEEDLARGRPAHNRLGDHLASDHALLDSKRALHRAVVPDVGAR